jgi:HD-like signal output (HDOD) protein
MAEKRILIADADPKAPEQFRQAMGESWVVTGVADGNAALAEAQNQSYDVFVANFDLPGIGGAELLNRLRGINPKAIRFIAAAEVFKEKVMCHVLGGHQFLTIPFDAATLRNLIERALATDYGMSSSMRELVGRIRTFPTIPSLYTDVVNALKDPNASTEEIGAIIAKDMAMTTKLVQVLNSAYFGLSRTITDPTEAVGILGFETVKSLIMTIKVLSQYDKVKPVYFSVDNIWRHSTQVARTARVMALLETSDNDCSATAYTAGLMHDLGKVILAANFDSQYHGAHTVARKQQIPLWDVEKDIFGATHGEIGAYLLGLWGMSAEVIRVAALHHHPIRGGDTAFTALTAVHVANVLENGEKGEDGLPPALLDMDYLENLGLQDRVQLWRAVRHEPDPASGQTRFDGRTQFTTRARSEGNTAFISRAQSSASSPKKSGSTGNTGFISKNKSESETALTRKRAASSAPDVLAPVAQTQSPESPEEAAPGHSEVSPAPGFRRWWKWLGLGLVIPAAAVVVIWLETAQLEKAGPKPMRHEDQSASAIPSRIVEQTTPVVLPATNAALAVLTPETPSSNATPAYVPQPSPVVSATPATNAAVSTVATAQPPPVVAAVPAVPKTVFDKLKLQAIFFTTQNPVALINGQLATVGQDVAECRVLEIGPSSVTFAHQQERKTLKLK